MGEVIDATIWRAASKKIEPAIGERAKTLEKLSNAAFRAIKIIELANRIFFDRQGHRTLL
jgi:hypothetical protein